VEGESEVHLSSMAKVIHAFPHHFIVVISTHPLKTLLFQVTLDDNISVTGYDSFSILFGAPHQIVLNIVRTLLLNIHGKP